jgi:hypothetical protein
LDSLEVDHQLALRGLLHQQITYAMSPPACTNSLES